MSIETKLKEMSDPGEFETLATAILRRSNPLYKTALQTGINTEGKPINDPVDGLTCVEEADSPHFVFFEYTTTKRSDLESKWLNDPDPDSDGSPGDLIKAAELASEIREESSEAEFTVVLVSNRVPDSEDVLQAETVAADQELNLDVWNVHRLAEFLRTDREGQTIRKQHFGTMEERLSESLLLELSADSLEGYKEAFRIGIGGQVVERSEFSTVRETIWDSRSSSYLVPLVGNSGFGKTITCYQVMEEWLESEKPTLRLEPPHVREAQSLSQALHSALSKLHPTLDSEAGQDAIEIAQENDQLLIVVDDLNRADDPSRLLSRIQNWVGGAQKQQSDGVNGTQELRSGDSTDVPVTILCPLWPRVWNKIEREAKNSKFVDPVELGPFSLDTATNLIRSQADSHDVEIGNQKAEDLAERVGRDPHIIGLLGELMGKKGTMDDLPEASKDVIQEYVDYAYDTASDTSSGHLVPADYAYAVEELSFDILESREFEPAWKSVRQWISAQDDLDAIRDLTEQAQLLLIFKQYQDWIISYRHDRLRDYLLSRHTINRVKNDNVNSGFLSDPYYASIFGKGIAYFRPSEKVIAQFGEQNPLTLFEALRELGGEPPEYEETLSIQIQQWLDSQGGLVELQSSMRNEILNVLVETNSPKVKDVTQSSYALPPVLLSRFRNGHLEAGIQYFNHDMFGSPSVNDSHRATVLEEVELRWKDQYTEGLSEILSSVSEEHIKGTLRLAGFLGQSELMPGIRDAWAKFSDEDDLLTAFLWAAFQCGVPDQSEIVDEIFERWSELPARDETNEDGIGSGDEVTKGSVFRDLKFALTNDISSEQAEYLIEAVDAFPELEWKMLHLLYRVPHPDALVFVVEKLGKYKRDAEGHGPISLISDVSRHWQSDSRRGHPLPSHCKERLEDIWSDDGNTDETRSVAFQIWSGASTEADLNELRNASENEIFAYPANHRCLQLGDETVFQSETFDIIETPGHIQSLSQAWCPEAYDLIEDVFEQQTLDGGDLSHHLSELLFRIPDEDAEELLDTYWDRICDHPRFFQAALYTATARTRELAKGMYKDVSETAPLFERISMNYGFNTYGRSELISKESLLSLEPYLDEIAERDLVEISQKAKELGMEEWSADKVRPRLSDEYRYRGHPTDADLLERLDEIEANDDYSSDMRVWMDNFDRRAEPKARAFRILEEWLDRDETVDRYTVVAGAIKGRGSREKLSILEDRPLEMEENDDLEQIYQDAKFAVQVRTLH